MVDERRREADDVLAAVDSVVAALRQSFETGQAAIERADRIVALRAAGHRYREIVDETGRPLIIELVTESVEHLRKQAAQLRRAHAMALHGEGLTMDEIAELFGVSRQRISAILKDAG